MGRGSIQELSGREGKNVLRDCPASCARGQSLRLHHRVNASLSCGCILVPSCWTRCAWKHGRLEARKITPPVPGAVDVGPLDDLDEFTEGDVADFDEAGIEDDDVRRVEGYPLGSPFPLDHCDLAIRQVAVSVNVETEFCRDKNEL